MRAEMGERRARAPAFLSRHTGCACRWLPRPPAARGRVRPHRRAPHALWGRLSRAWRPPPGARPAGGAAAHAVRPLRLSPSAGGLKAMRRTMKEHTSKGKVAGGFSRGERLVGSRPTNGAWWCARAWGPAQAHGEATHACARPPIPREMYGWGKPPPTHSRARDARATRRDAGTRRRPPRASASCLSRPDATGASDRIVPQHDARRCRECGRPASCGTDTQGGRPPSHPAAVPQGSAGLDASASTRAPGGACPLNAGGAQPGPAVPCKQRPAAELWPVAAPQAVVPAPSSGFPLQVTHTRLFTLNTSQLVESELDRRGKPGCTVSSRHSRHRHL
jgi:hypothetical protein